MFKKSPQIYLEPEIATVKIWLHSKTVDASSLPLSFSQAIAHEN